MPRFLDDGRRCPRCGGTLISDGDNLWCSFVGSQGRGPVQEKPCTFGIDWAVSADWRAVGIDGPPERGTPPT